MNHKEVNEIIDELKGIIFYFGNIASIFKEYKEDSGNWIQMITINR